MKSNKYRVIILVAIAISTLLLATFDWTGIYANQTVEAISKLHGELVNRPAPGFELKDTADKTYSLSSFQGKVVFLNFWASYCEPCRKEMPSMEQLVRQYKAQGLTMVAISQDVQKADMIKFINEFLPNQHSKMTFLWDSEGKVARSYGTSLIPETYLIDRNGQLIARFASSYDWSTPQAKAMIEALLKGEKKQRLL